MEKTQCLGAFCGGGTPVPIPNTAVKPASADGSLKKARVGQRQDFASFFIDKNCLLCYVLRVTGASL